MASYISTKQSLLRFAVSLILATGVAFLLSSYLTGPKLGIMYDLLLRQRPALTIANEILIIDTNSSQQTPELPDYLLEPDTVRSVLLTMTEFDASALILQAPVLGLTTGSSAKEEEIRYYFDREFDILGQNIRNFFDAIRTGSIAPYESVYYVNELVNLSNRGKDRLISALVSRDEAGIRRLEQAAAVFGNIRRPGDLLVQVIRLGEGDRPETLADYGWYSHVRPDKDGVLRRILPFDIGFSGEGAVSEHIIYGALKNRFQSQEIHQSEDTWPFFSGPVLVLTERNSGTVRKIPLDKDGALLFEIPHSGDGFRNIKLRDFLDYEEADQGLRRLLGEAEVLSIRFRTPGEENPLYLYDHALSAREDLLQNPTELYKAFWKNARSNYFSSLDHFLYGNAQNNITDVNELVLLFGLRQKYQELLVSKTKLESALINSFCILGNYSVVPGFTTDTEASALLANSILTGRSITPGDEFPLLIGAFVLALISALLICKKKVAAGLCYGLLIAFISILGLSVSFVLTGIWYDPLVPVAAVGTVTLISFIWALMLKRRHKRFFRSSYGPNVSASGLKQLIKAGKPVPGEVITLEAAVVAVKNPALFIQEQRDNPKSAAAALAAYWEKCGDIFKKAGGLIAGNGGDIVLACFGSPPETVILGPDVDSALGIHAKGAPALRAVGVISELLKNDDTKIWSFGMDSGLCAFTWRPLTGYSVFGAPVIKARTLSNLTERYQTHVLITDSFFQYLPDLPVKKAAVFKEWDGSRGETFYELLL
ncbi:MAG: hypothetical protein LBI14_06015 [Treponema sp.]|jgi:hypothetical protein|nr:hypothetical protein [Treponema sp.]